MPPAAWTWSLHKMPVVTDALTNSQDYRGVRGVRFPRQPVSGDLRQVESKEYRDGGLEGAPGGLCHSAVE